MSNPDPPALPGDAVPPVPPAPPAPAVPPPPPGPAVWSGPPAWTPPVGVEGARPSTRLAIAVAVLVGIVIPLALGSIVAELRTLARFDDAVGRDGTKIATATPAQLDALGEAERLGNALGALLVLGVLATGALFAIWVWREATNARTLGARDPSPAALLTVTLVPCASTLALPVLFALLARRSGVRRAGALAVVWGIAFAAFQLFFISSSGNEPSDDESFRHIVEVYPVARYSAAAAAAFLIVAGVAFAMSVVLVSRHHERRFASVVSEV